MSTEIRFLLAIVLMIGVLVVTNVIFPPVPPEDAGPGADTIPAAVQVQDPAIREGGDATSAEADSARAAGADTPATGAGDTATREPPAGRAQAGQDQAAPRIPTQDTAPDVALPTDAQEASEEPEALVTAEGPLYRYTFSTRGARLRSAELLNFQSFTRDGPVQLIPEESEHALGHRILVQSDTVDLRTIPFQVTPAEGVSLTEGGEPRTLTFTYQHPDQDFRLELEYTFRPDSYLVTGRGRITGVSRSLVLTDLGRGIAFNEADPDEDARAMAFVGNHLQQGIEATNLSDVEEVDVWEGPFLWAAFKSKYFVVALLAGAENDAGVHLGGIISEPTEAENRARVSVTQPVATDGAFGYRLFLGPQDFARLSDLGDDLQDVNPYGWKFFRPIIRPFTAVVVKILTFLHDQLGWGYGWVLMLFGVMMRVVLFPFNTKAMRAQIRNMQVQPLLKEIQEKYKDQPEKLQKEMMKLYKEHGFNPLAGCLPMLLPWPILITLFFVFQNTIELRGVPFLWLPDLSAADPFYILPVILMVSMFLLQFISYRSMDEPNPQMKMMMWVMPLFMGFVFSQFASGLNLYYATANVATLPQQFWIANERKKAEPIRPTGGDDEDEGGGKKGGKKKKKGKK